VLVAVAISAGLVVAALLAIVLWLSFAEGLVGDKMVAYGLDHYRDIFLDDFTYRVLWNTILFTLTTLIVSFVLAFPIAWLIERTDFPGKSIVLSLMTMGLLIPGFAVALGWVFLLNPTIGLINHALRDLLALSDAPFNVSTIPGMGCVEGLSLTPLAFIMISVVLRSMDPSLEEAAAMSGAPPWRAVLGVTLRVLWPGLLGTIIYVSAVCFAAFDVPAILGLTSRIYTFSTYVYHELSPADGPIEYGDVAALSVFMIGLAIVLSWCAIRTQRDAWKYTVIAGKAYRPRTIALGRARYPWVCFVVGYFILSQLLPFVMLVWAALIPYLELPSAGAFADVSLANFGSIPRGILMGAIGNTVMLMVAVPTLTLAASLAISWVLLRTRIPGRGLLEFSALLPLTVPPIVFAVAALLFALFVSRHVVPIYGTIWILVVAYSVARLSYGTRMTNGALIQIHRELEEAAAMSAAGRFATLRDVILPILSPTLLYAWIWIALLSYRELTLPVVLSTDQKIPVSVLVWGYILSSGYGTASAVTLVMLLLMAPVLVVYWVVARRAGIVAPR